MIAFDWDAAGAKAMDKYDDAWRALAERDEENECPARHPEHPCQLPKGHDGSHKCFCVEPPIIWE